MNIVKFIRKQGKTKEADPKIFEESIECSFPGRKPGDVIIPLSSIKSELIKCSFKAKEPNEFLAIVSGKAKKIEVDCLDTVRINFPNSYDIKTINFQNISVKPNEDTGAYPNKYELKASDVSDYAYVEKVEEGHHIYCTMFFGDFLKMIMHSQYNAMRTDINFYTRLGDVPVIIDEDSYGTDLFNLDFALFNYARDPEYPYFSIFTEKGETYFIHMNI